jgi:hypothetical protein
MPLDMRIGAFEEVDQGRDVTGLLQPPDIRDR